MKMLCYALFHCNPAHPPPFALELGFSDNSVFSIPGCAHIPEALEKMQQYCDTEGVVRSSGFTLLYPIYLEAMDTDDENTMHQVAWLIKDQADLNQWNFARIGGYTGKTPEAFVS